MRRARSRLAILAASAACTALALAGCGGPKAQDPNRQIGPNPWLPDIHQYLLPPMHVAEIVGWKNAVPKVAPGLQVQAMATGLKNPRSIFVLPNGDILVAESGGPTPPIHRPKEFIMGWLEKKSHSKEEPGQRIILLRDADGDGVPELKTGFIDHLNGPFGMALVGGVF